MALEIDTLIRWGVIITVGIVILYLYQITRKTSTVVEVPRRRVRDSVITRAGRAEVKSTQKLSGGKIRFNYDNPDYPTMIYYESGEHCDLVPITEGYDAFGNRQNMWIEYDVLMKLAYTHEAYKTRKLYQNILKGLEQRRYDLPSFDENSDNFITTLHQAVKQLEAQPEKVVRATEELRRVNDELTRAKARLTAQEAGIKGETERRTEQLERIAARRASSTNRQQQQE